MPWFVIDDSAHTHPKIMKAGNAALGLWLRCGSYAAQHLTDGIVPGVVAAMYGTAPQIRKLVTVGMWHEAGHECPNPKCAQPVVGDFAIHDYLTYNPSRKAVEEKRDRAAAKKRRQRSGEDSPPNPPRFEDESKRNRERFDDDSSSKKNGHYDSDAGHGGMSPGDSLGTRARAVPSPPLPSPTSGGTGSERANGRDARAHEPALSQIPATWQPAEKDLDAARADVDRLGRDAVADATRKFVNYHQAKAITADDFGPLWVTWLNRERAEPPQPQQQTGAVVVPLQPRTGGTDGRLSDHGALIAELEAKEARS